MRRLVANTVLGLQVAAFAVMCLICSPVILFKFGVDWVREGIEARWPDSDRARAVSFWIGLLSPLVLCLVLGIGLGFAIVRVRALKSAEPVAAPDPAT